MRIQLFSATKRGDATAVHLVRSIMKIRKQAVESYTILAKYSHGRCRQVCIVVGGNIRDWLKQICIKLGPQFSGQPVQLCITALRSQVYGAAGWFLNSLSKTRKRPRAAISISLIITTFMLVFLHAASESPTTDNIKSLPNNSLVTQVLDSDYDISPVVSEIELSKSAAVTKSMAPHNQPSSLVPGDYHETVRVLGNVDLYEHGQTHGATQEVVVAILDTGIDARLDALDGLVIAGVDFADSGTLQDIYGHGTYVAAIIARRGSGESSTDLLPQCRLLNVKVADDHGRCTATTVAKGIVWAADNGANIINLSLEVREPSPVLEEAVNYAWNRGAVVVAAAGNDGSKSPVYPAYYEPCIAVAAITQHGKIAPLSNYGDWVDLAAPGFYDDAVLSHIGRGCKSGTSFSCAYVSRIAAFFFSVVSDVDGNGRANDEVRGIIEENCREVVLPCRTCRELGSPDP